MNTDQDPRQLIKALAGPDAELRADQEEAITALVDQRQRVLVVQRTGWGKSAVYFVSAKLLRAKGDGMTLLVSPLLALMRDQIQAATRMGLHAVTVNSANIEDWGALERKVLDDEVDLLAISPERLNNPGFIERVLDPICDRIGLVVIDEAHCLSQWGMDFRPDYSRIREVLARLRPDTSVLATTATAPSSVVADLEAQLGTTPLTLRGSLDRESLHLSVVMLGSPEERMAWLAEWIPAQEGAGIVYCLTQASAEQTSAWLQSQGIEAACYTGGTPTEERERLEEAFRANEIKVLVATSALGMGYDKSDVAFVANLGAPASITAYYQMVGRAGRSLDRADVVLLPGPEDRRIWDWFDSVAFPPEPIVRSVLEVLDSTTGPVSEVALEAYVDIRRTRLSTLMKVLDVEGAVRKVKGGWERTEQPWAYDQARYDNVREVRRADQALMLAYQTTKDCRMVFMRQALDDPAIATGSSCGRCDNCSTLLQVNVPSQLVAEASRSGRARSIALPARKMWPSGLKAPKGKIPEANRAADGRALCEVGSAGWLSSVEAWLAAPASEPSEELVGAIVAQLRDWGWPHGRPRWVTWVPSRTHNEHLRSLASRLGEIGKLQVLEALSRAAERPPQAGISNSAHAAANVWGAFKVDHDLPAGPVLVLDDVWDSGWTMTAVADLLSEAGALPVYPFALVKGR